MENKTYTPEIMNEDQKNGMYKKQTAVEWLLDWMEKNQYFIGNDLLEAFEQAKAMHKEEIMDANAAGYRDGILYSNGEDWNYQNPEHYYDETYGKQ